MKPTPLVNANSAIDRNHLVTKKSQHIFQSRIHMIDAVEGRTICIQNVRYSGLERTLLWLVTKQRWRAFATRPRPFNNIHGDLLSIISLRFKWPLNNTEP